jgi:hypothetical protein
VTISLLSLKRIRVEIDSIIARDAATHSSMGKRATEDDPMDSMIDEIIKESWISNTSRLFEDTVAAYLERQRADPASGAGTQTDASNNVCSLLLILLFS